MKSDGNDFNYFKLTKLANYVQFKRTFMFCLENRGAGQVDVCGVQEHIVSDGISDLRRNGRLVGPNPQLKHTVSSSLQKADLQFTYLFMQSTQC